MPILYLTSDRLTVNGVEGYLLSQTNSSSETSLSTSDEFILVLRKVAPDGTETAISDPVHASTTSTSWVEVEYAFSLTEHEIPAGYALEIHVEYTDPDTGDAVSETFISNSYPDGLSLDSVSIFVWLEKVDLFGNTFVRMAFGSADHDSRLEIVSPFGFSAMKQPTVSRSASIGFATAFSTTESPAVNRSVGIGFAVEFGPSISPAIDKNATIGFAVSASFQSKPDLPKSASVSAVQFKFALSSTSSPSIQKSADVTTRLEVSTSWTIAPSVQISAETETSTSVGILFVVWSGNKIMRDYAGWKPWRR